MDGRNFDTWTRVLAGTSRRETLKLLIAGLASGSLATVATQGVLAQVAPLACGRDGDTCNDKKGSNDCCGGFRCKNGRCRNKNGNGNNCGTEGDSCNDRNGNSDCCSGFDCRNDRCRDNGGNNGGNNGRRCGKEGADCRDRDCCSGFRCKNQSCRRKR